MILPVLVSLFVTLLLVANIVSVKLIGVGSWVVPAGVIVYPLTFLLTDVIAELYGRRIASRVIWIGFAVSIVMVVFVYLARILPPAGFWDGQAAFDATLGMVPRIVLASMFAYLISQHHDVMAFYFWRRKTGARHLWLRNNASTMASQAIDTALFISIAFWGTMPVGIIFNMMLTQYLIKLGIAVLDTPFCYLLVGLLRGRVGKSGINEQVLPEAG
jgi:queuosine precursor transporter